MPSTKIRSVDRRSLIARVDSAEKPEELARWVLRSNPGRNLNDLLGHRAARASRTQFGVSTLQM